MRIWTLVCLTVLTASCASSGAVGRAPEPAKPAAGPQTERAAPPARATAAPERPDAAPSSPGTAGASPAQTTEDQTREGGQAQADRRPEPRQPRPYDRVITKDAKSDEGVFTVHRIRDRVYYEIPSGELGKPFLWVSQIASTTLGAGYGGQAVSDRVVRWERRDNRVLLRSVRYDIVADDSLPIARAVRASNTDAILMSFDIEAFGKNDAPVIDVTRLFTTEVPELSARTRLRARGFDSNRSFVERAISFPANVEVEAIHTYTAPPDSPPAAGAPAPPTPAPSSFGSTGTVLMHYSMVKLPEQPMKPRLFDSRVGYFSVRQLDFGQDEHRAPERRYITRWRLEKKNPADELSEPVKPIVYWIDPATPTKWVSYVKQGVESWQSAFEAAGFKNAILAREAPTSEQDPEWSPEDARYSVIRWLPSTVQNASGPHIHDPRTGEILETDIQMHHNVMNLVTAWYFVQVGPLDPRAQKVPLPDGLLGQLVQHVVAHEVGHTLGFQHNMKASSTYPLDKVRDPHWLSTMGHTPTLMDYSRFNYVAQPEDKVDPNDLIPRIGPYDRWATMWGYRPLPAAKTPDEEKPTLDAWARQQDETPWLRFSTARAQGSDPGDLTEAVGDADAVKATELGLKNLVRVAEMLLPAVTKEGEPFDRLEEFYGRMLAQWVLELNHVVAVVGGFESQEKHAGQNGVRFVAVPRDRQLAAVQFLNERAFQTPQWAIKPEILRRIEPTGVLDRVTAAHRAVLASLLSPARFARLVEQESIDGNVAYRPIDFLADVRKGIWRELEDRAIRIDSYRRNLQRGYLELLDERLNGRGPVRDDARPFLRGELQALDATIRATLARAADRATRLHLEDARVQIARVLDPKIPRPAAPAGPQLVVAFPSADSRFTEEDPLRVLVGPGTSGCWPDYLLRPTGWVDGGQ